MPTFLQHLDPATQIFFLVPLALIAIDVLTGIANALRWQHFSVAYLGLFAQNNLLPYVGLLATSLVMPLMAGVPYAVAATSAKVALSLFCMSQIHSISANVATLLGRGNWVNSLDRMINDAVAKLFPNLAVPSTAAPTAPTTTSEPAK